MKKRSKGIAIFCWVMIFYSSLIMLALLYVLIRSHLPLQRFPGIIRHTGEILFFNLFPIILAILLLRLNNIARRVFIISAVIMIILDINMSIGYVKHQVPALVEKINQTQMEKYHQMGDTHSSLPAAPIAFFIVSVFYNLPRIAWIIIYLIGIILFTRPKVKEQFKYIKNM